MQKEKSSGKKEEKKALSWNGSKAPASARCTQPLSVSTNFF
jgi:hypothetical protein